MELDYPERLQRMLLTPQRELTVELVVQMDDGQIEVYNAYRVQHNNSRGPYKVPHCYEHAWHSHYTVTSMISRKGFMLPLQGGLRYHPAVDLDDVRRWAFF